MKISASLIIKNEEAMLGKCLKSIKGVDEIIIVDTGSDDKSIEIAKEAGAKVFTDYKWNDHFSEARNESKKHCTGDWLLIIDGDEELMSLVPSIRKLLSEPFMKEKSLVLFTVDTGMETNPQPRLFRNSPDIQWFGAAHNKVVRVKPDGTMVDLAHEPGAAHFSNLKVKAYLSPNHKIDPDRTLRIMSGELSKGIQSIGKIQYTRYLYYVSREWLNRKDPIRALYYLAEYTEIAPHTNEMADAWYIMATCHIDLGQIQNNGVVTMDQRKLLKAVDAALQVIKYLPTHKAAYALLHNLSAGDRKPFWAKMFHMANNENVLFIRRGGEKLMTNETKKK